MCNIFLINLQNMSDIYPVYDILIFLMSVQFMSYMCTDIFEFGTGH